MTTTTHTYYAITDAYGPISVRLAASTIEDARDAFDSLDGNPVDDCRTDIESDFEIDTDGDVAEQLRDLGGKMVARLDDATEANTSAGWYLWEMPATQTKTYHIATDSGSATISAESIDAACVKYASAEGWRSVTDEASMRAYVERVGGYVSACREAE